MNNTDNHKYAPITERIISVISVLLILAFFSSCKKEPGEGGTATIKGKLLCGNYNSAATPVTAEDGIGNESVYIVYGDNTIADHNEKTSYDGSFEFRFLRKGTYKIWAYSLDKNFKIPVETIVEKTIEITKKNEIVEVLDFTIYKEADKDGNSSIKGKVFLRDYDLAFQNLQTQYYKPDEDVFIIYGNDTIVDDNTKTSYNGSFQFDGLRKGVYKIYALSKDSVAIVQGENSPPDSAVMRTVEITSNKQEIILGDIVILKN